MTNVPIQSLIDHIKTAIDVDSWAKEMLEELLKDQEPIIRVFMPIGNRYIVTKQCNYRCANCGELICRSDLFCEHCGRPEKWE